MFSVDGCNGAGNVSAMASKKTVKMPKPEPKRHQRVVILMSVSEEKKLRAAARKSGYSCCAFVRRMLGDVID